VTERHDLRPVVESWIEAQGMMPLAERMFISGYCDLVGVRYKPRVGRAISGIEKFVTVELKINDVAGVIRQAQCHLRRAHASYAAMPEARIEKMRPATLDKFRAVGVGLLCVSDVVRVLIEPQWQEMPFDYQNIYAKRWWRAWKSWLKKQSKG
jgi:hypothetical protein